MTKKALQLLGKRAIDISRIFKRKLDFCVFADRYVKKMVTDGRAKSAKNYALAVGNLRKFLKCCSIDYLDINDVTAIFLRKYHAWMLQKGLGHRGQVLYLICLRKIFNEAVLEFNDYDTGNIPIKVQPFTRFKVPSPVYASNAERRALPVETIRRIFAYQPKSKREEFAKDMYMFSFALCGMNAADLYTCEANIKTDMGIKLMYNRAKTKSRRADGAEMQVAIPNEFLYLFEKYKNISGGKRIFCFANKYVDIDGFGAAINRGLRKIGESDEVKVDRLTLYMARHSWATIAVNELNIPEEQVDDCLAHAPMRKMLRRYVKKDWSKIDNANRKVLDYVLEKSSSSV